MAAATLLVGLGVWVAFGQPATPAPTASGPALVEAVEVIGMTVDRMDRALAFYTQVLPFEIVSDTEVAGEDYDRLQGVFGARARVVRLRLGEEAIELTDYLTTAGRPIPVESRSNDHWFQHVAIIVGDMDEAYRRLRQHDVEYVSPEPQRLPDWNPNAGGIEAFYFRDPDGHPLEILEFPPGKGEARWQEPTDRLFLGIDHTAIVVSDTDASLELYRDALGMTVAGHSENYGVEQERLNSVFGARLRITALRAEAGRASSSWSIWRRGMGDPGPSTPGRTTSFTGKRRFAPVESSGWRRRCGPAGSGSRRPAS